MSVNFRKNVSEHALLLDLLVPYNTESKSL